MALLLLLTLTAVRTAGVEGRGPVHCRALGKGLPQLPQPQAPVLRARRRERSQERMDCQRRHSAGSGPMRKREARVQHPPAPTTAAAAATTAAAPDASRYGSTRAAVTTAAVAAPMPEF